jgi:ABC-type nitrate/sulfonate/bicarbonate transport system ATPase subunit
METGYEYSFGKSLLDVKGLSVKFKNKNGDETVVLRDVNFDIKNITRPGRKQGQVDALLAPSGCGKCFAKGTMILMHDGSIKPVENVSVGDKVMGPDSKARNVTSLGNGFEKMYKIKPVKGESFTVNGSHILHLSYNSDHNKMRNNETVDISVNDYLLKSNNFKNLTKLKRTGVDFPSQKVELSAYMLGLWLADGNSDCFRITNEDAEIVDHIIEFANIYDLKVSPYVPNIYGLTAGHDRTKSPTSFLHRLNLLNNKHIPSCYLINDRNTRLELLAGLLDGDGHLHGNCFEIITKFSELAKNILFLSRSLGLAAYSKPCVKTMKRKDGSVFSGNYFRIGISGNTDEIPVKINAKRAKPRKQIKNVLRVGFEIIPEGIGEYFGFTIDEDHLFLLADFTITHNTTLFRAISGLDKIQTGSVDICINGDDTMVPVHVGLVGVVAQDYPLFNHMTVMGNLLKAATIKNKNKDSAKEIVMKYLELFQLVDKINHYPHQLSGGQRQRVAIIQQMVCDNHLLLMDEPFSGLDILMKEEVQHMICGVASQNDLNSVIITTHDIQSAIAVADTILLLGHERDAAGNVVPGAFVKYTYNLIDMGLSWRPDVAELPAFTALEKEIKARFKEL